MTLYETIQSDMRTSLKSGETVKLSVVRMLISSIKMRELEIGAKAFEDAEVIQALRRATKQRKESIAQFEKGNRKDLADKEALELTMLEAYLPASLNEDELMQIVKDAITQTGASAKKDIGKVMKAAMERSAGRADGKSINTIAAKLLP